MTVLLVAPGVPPPIGGLERMAAELHRHLRVERSVYLVATSETAASTVDSSIVGRPRSTAARAVVPLRFAAAIRAQLRGNEVELVHALTWRSAVPVMAIPRSRRPPTIVHCNGAELLRARNLAWLRDRVLTQADALVALSHHTASVVESLCGRRPTVIPPGIDLERFTTIANTRSRGGPFRVVSVGRLEPRKHHDELVRAVADVAKTGIDCRLTIIGDGAEASRLDALITTLGCGSRVEAVRHGDDARLLAELTRAHAFALLCRDTPTDIEGFGIAFVEAAAAGLPVVAGDSLGALDAVQPGGNAFVTRSQAEVVDALRELATNEDTRSAMAVSGLAFARQFAWTTVTPRVLAEYEAVIESSLNAD